MKPSAANRLFSFATVVAMLASIVLPGCAQKTAQNTSQSTPTPALGGLSGALGGSTASPTDTASGGNGDVGGAAGGAAGDAADILGSGNTITTRQQVNQAVARLKIFADALPKADLSVEGLADSLPADANSLHQFVRDQIRLDIYPGAMRGALGAVLAHAANPTDKALLLAALLQRKGMQVRFARGTLSDSEIATLQDLVYAAAPPVQPVAASDALLTQMGIKSADVAALAHSFEPSWQKFVSGGVQFGQDQASKLIDVLSHHGIEVNSTASSEWGTALRQHYWVQVNQNGSWVDLDPSAPSLRPGQHLGNADASFSSAALPDDAYVVLEIRIVATFLRGGALQDQTLLGIAQKVPDLVGQSLEISILPTNDVKPEDLGSQTTFVPRIYIGDREARGLVLDLQKDGPQLAQMRLEMKTSAPGRPAVSYRRWVLDRRNGSSLTPMSGDVLARGVTTMYQGLIAPGSFSDSFIVQKTADFMAAVKPALIEMATPKEQQSAGGPRFAGRAFPMRVLEFFQRDRIMADALEQTQSGKVRLYPDRPEIAFVRLDTADVPAGAVARLSFDIVENGMAAAGRDPRVAGRLNVARGILDTRIEQHVMAPKKAYGTPQLIDAAGKQGIKTWVLAPSDAQAAQKSALGLQTVESIQDTLRSGSAAVAVERPAVLNGGDRFGWWAVDPKTGNTVGRMSGGAGNAMSETAILYTRIGFFAYHAFMALAECSHGAVCGCIVSIVEAAGALLAPIHSIAGEAGAAAVSFVACPPGEAHGGGCAGEHGGTGGEHGGAGGDPGGGGGPNSSQPPPPPDWQGGTSCPIPCAP